MLPHNGQGGSQSIEDAYTLGRCLAAYFQNPSLPLERYLKVYEQVRLPRTAAVQASSREAGEIYEQIGEMAGVEDQEERYRLMDDRMATRMHWMWGYNVDTEIEKHLTALQPRASM
jgi:2-polyprenyl-6-methoxyphenol hydroxylase-like FAD-dependent oxidoreductase